MSNPPIDIIELVQQIDRLLEETHTSSFGFPPTQGEIEHYEENKEKILELCHKAIPHVETALTLACDALEEMADEQSESPCECFLTNWCPRCYAKRTLSQIRSLPIK